MFFVCPSRSHIIISKTRDQMWSSLKLFNGHVRMASDVSSDKHILLWHQIAPELYCVLCSVVYWPLYKSTESAWQGRVVGRFQNPSGQQIFSYQKKSFATMAARIREGAGGTSLPCPAPIFDGPSMAGGWGVSPLSVRSYGKYAAAGDISEQPSFLSDDVSIYNSQNACLCCHRIFFFLWMLAFLFFRREESETVKQWVAWFQVQGSAIRCSKSGLDRFLAIHSL